MDTKHTPGPWIVEKVGVGRLEVCNEETLFTVAHINVAMSQGNNFSMRNARLISAAPELLAALLSAQDLILNRWGYPADSSGRDSSLSQIESAIAKATGGA